MVKRWGTIVSSTLVMLALIEIAGRLFPSLMPGQIGINARSVSYARIAPDYELGFLLKAPKRQRYTSEGFEVVMEQRPFADSPGVGRRVNPEASVTSLYDPYDLVALGDSFVYAAEVPWDRSWVGRLEAKGGWRIANLGVPGYGVIQEAALLRRYGGPLKPKRILLLMTANDAHDDEIFLRWKKERDDIDSPWDSYGTHVMCAGLSLAPGRPCDVFRSMRQSGSIWLSLFSEVWMRLYSLRKDEFYGEAAMKATEGGLEEVRAEAKRLHAPLLVALGDGWRRQSPAAADRLGAWLGQRNIPFVDLGDHGELPRIPIDRHWTVGAHEAVAQRLFEFLTKNGVRPLNP